jgi:hypothetical protein
MKSGFSMQDLFWAGKNRLLRKVRLPLASLSGQNGARVFMAVSYQGVLVPGAGSAMAGRMISLSGKGKEMP